MVTPITRPPRSCAPRLAASITPAYPPVQIVKPESASNSPTRNACEYSRSDSRHFDPPKIVTIRSCDSLIWLRQNKSADFADYADHNRMSRFPLSILLG